MTAYAFRTVLDLPSVVGVDKMMDFILNKSLYSLPDWTPAQMRLEVARLLKDTVIRCEELFAGLLAAFDQTKEGKDFAKGDPITQAWVKEFRRRKRYSTKREKMTSLYAIRELWGDKWYHDFGWTNEVATNDATLAGAVRALAKARDKEMWRERLSATDVPFRPNGELSAGGAGTRRYADLEAEEGRKDEPDHGQNGVEEQVSGDEGDEADQGELESRQARATGERADTTEERTDDAIERVEDPIHFDMNVAANDTSSGSGALQADSTARDKEATMVPEDNLGGNPDQGLDQDQYDNQRRKQSRTNTRNKTRVKSKTRTKTRNASKTERDESSRRNEDSEVEGEEDLPEMDIEEGEGDLGLGTQENKAPCCESIEAVAANGSRAIPAHFSAIRSASLATRRLPLQTVRTMTGTAGTDKTPKDFTDSAPGGMSTSNNPDEIPADAKALEPDAGEEAKKKEEAGMDTLPTIT
ncbi:hypothetical protein QFC20_004865 [Naganishia adeliensis]|uniref:Uncharacterized protein n=1 Tax=Naganishia adeliensis TaxID=92952 RepID=A0ACC2VV68_9TREE|nr:hypothetical protein QFC20_004865 [Naganishia adeliensis]